MTESQFIERNKADWKKLEFLIDHNIKDADKLNDLFTKVSSDLAYARTFFPNRSVRLYLNDLTKQVFDMMRPVQERSNLAQLLFFFKEVLPFEMYQSRRAMFVSLAIFVTAIGIGIFSCIQDPSFPRLILGDGYVNMTEQNIKEGDPMAVYKDENRAGMFFGISINNIRVSFLAFVLGLTGAIGTIFVLISNGIMLGAFQYFFYQKGLFLESFSTIWIHGTVEIASIIIAGGAGIVLGNGLVFPGSFRRRTSLYISAKRALRIILGLIPMFIVAALLESYVTRLTDLPYIMKFGIIGLSAIFIIAYFVVLPWIKGNNPDPELLKENMIPHKEENYKVERFRLRSLNEIFGIGLMKYRENFGQISISLAVPTVLTYAILLWFYTSNLFLDYDLVFGLMIDSYIELRLMDFSIIVLFFAFGLLSIFFNLYDQQKDKKLSFFGFIRKHFAYTYLMIFVYSLPLYFLSHNWCFLYFLLIPPHVLWLMLIDKIDHDAPSITLIGAAYRNYSSYLGIHLLSLIFYFLVLWALNSDLATFLVEFLAWHNLFENEQAYFLFLANLNVLITMCLIFPLNLFLCFYRHASNVCDDSAIDLNLAYESFGQHSKISN